MGPDASAPLSARARACITLLLAGCSVGDLNLEGKSCPCAGGYRCDETSNLCVRSQRPSIGEAGPAGDDAAAGGDGGDAGVDSMPTIACEAGLVGCGSVCVDTQTNARDCGSCGHDCLGGACTAGKCQPVVLASATQVGGLALAGAMLYWTVYGNGSANGKIVQCSTNGCNNAPVSLATGQANPMAIAADASNLYWTNYIGGQIMQCAAVACAPTHLADNQVGPISIVADATTVYWVNTGSGTANDGSVFKCTIGGCGGVPTLLAGSQLTPQGIALNSATVYWLNAYMAGIGGELRMCATSGCNNAPSVFIAASFPFGFAIDAADVFWTTNNRVLKCAKVGCNPQAPTVVASSAPLGVVAVDPTAIYWADNRPGLSECLLTGCGNATVEFPTGSDAPIAVISDVSAVYFATNTTVYKLAK